MIEKGLQQLGVTPQNRFEYLAVRGLRVYAQIERDYHGEENINEARKLAGQGVPLLVVANHTGNIDGPEVYSALQLFGVGKEPVGIAGCKLKRQIQTRVLSNAVPAIWVVPDGLLPKDQNEAERFPGMNSRAYRAAKATLNAGHPVILFVEGSRSRTGELQQPPEKVAGYYRLIQNLHILPISLIGTDQVMPVGTDVPFPKRNKKVIIIGNQIITPEEIRVVGMGLSNGERRKAENDYVMMRIAEGLPPEMHGVYRNRIQELHRKSYR